MGVWAEALYRLLRWTCDSSSGTGTVTTMSRRNQIALVGLLLSCFVPIIVAVVLAAGKGNDAVTPAVNTTATARAAEPAVGEIVVSALNPDTVVILHEDVSGSTSFDQGVLWVSVPRDTGTFRWISGPGIAAGGRQLPSAALFAALPAGVNVVVSYDVDGVPASLYGTLGGSVEIGPDTVAYPISVYDAPGSGSTYTLSGSYDIPATLSNVRVFISGQTVPG